MPFAIKRNDLKPSYPQQLTNAGVGLEPIDLTGCTVWFIMTLAGASSPTLQKQAVIDDAASGRVHYDWASGDTATAGLYKAEWEILYPDGKSRTWPSLGYQYIQIDADLGSAGVVFPPAPGAAVVVLENSPTVGDQLPYSHLVGGIWKALWKTPSDIISRTRGGFGEDTSARTGFPLLAAGSVSYVTPPAGSLVGTTATQTLTGKTIDGASNTFANVPTSALTGTISSSSLTGTIPLSLLGNAIDAGTCTPKQFGAVGDDTTDDSAAFTAARAALAAGTYHTLDLGALKYFAPGITFDVPAGCSLVGRGPGVSQIRTNTDNALVTIGGEDVYIAGLTLKGSATGSSQHLIKDGTTGVAGSGHSRVFIRDVQLLDAGGYGYYYQENPLNGGASTYLGPSLTGVRAKNCDIGFYFGNKGEYVGLANCHSQTSRTKGWYIGAGNINCAGCTSTADLMGVDIPDAPNGGHGEWAGGAINHPTGGVSVNIATSLGHKFGNVSMYCGTGGITLGASARGILFDGCQISATSIIAGLLTEARFADCIIVTDPTLTFDSAAYVEFVNCRKPDGSIPTTIQAHVRQTFTFGANADATLGGVQSCAEEIQINTGALASSGKTITINWPPNAGLRKFVKNNTVYSVNIKWQTGTSVTIGAGLSAIVGADGTNATKVITEATAPTSAGVSGHANLSDGAGGWTDWTGVTGGSNFIDFSAGATTAGALRFALATPRAITAGALTLLGSASGEGFLFTDSSYGNQCTNGRIFASTQVFIGIAGSTHFMVSSSGLNRNFMPVSIEKANIATTSTDGLSIDNTTASTSGVPVQYSTRLRQRGHSWNSTALADETHDYAQEVQPATNAGTTTSALVFKRSVAGGAYSDLMRLLSTGGYQIPTAISTPANPPAGSVAIWFDGTNLKAKNSAGAAVTWA